MSSPPSNDGALLKIAATHWTFPDPFKALQPLVREMNDLGPSVRFKKHGACKTLVVKMYLLHSPETVKYLNTALVQSIPEGRLLLKLFLTAAEAAGMLPNVRFVLHAANVGTIDPARWPDLIELPKSIEEALNRYPAPPEDVPVAIGDAHQEKSESDEDEEVGGDVVEEEIKVDEEDEGEDEVIEEESEVDELDDEEAVTQPSKGKRTVSHKPSKHLTRSQRQPSVEMHAPSKRPPSRRLPKRSFESEGKEEQPIETKVKRRRESSDSTEHRAHSAPGAGGSREGAGRKIKPTSKQLQVEVEMVKEPDMLDEIIYKPRVSTRAQSQASRSTKRSPSTSGKAPSKKRR